MRRFRGERFNPAFAVQRRTVPTASVIDILQPHGVLLMEELPGAMFQQDNARPPTVRMLRYCLRHITTFPWRARFKDLSPIENIWDQLG
ncbi:transposable element Tcb2 transposase [Trichonephila clavipes]|uniref:Transposable element Tcb2 transposase n=1 Tax=Trichonephila clavipes TaxID=2585209 RepID=A0A8X6W2Y1_TRICX|nr:transposable element Tcb2 transposase [Trichonephila clavipes]